MQHVIKQFYRSVMYAHLLGNDLKIMILVFFHAIVLRHVFETSGFL